MDGDQQLTELLERHPAAKAAYDKQMDDMRARMDALSKQIEDLHARVEKAEATNRSLRYIWLLRNRCSTQHLRTIRL